MEETTKQVTPPEKRNPTGKGGFGDNPQNRSDGGWKKENTISYQYKRFMHMKESELQATVAKEKADDTWTVAMDIAYRRVVAAQKSLADVKEITDRTEGKPTQQITHEISMNPTKQILNKFGLGEGDAGQTPEA